MDKDIHIIYADGTGGHICSHLVLESRHHFCIFDEFPIPKTSGEFLDQFEIVKKEQWNITDPEKWCAKHFWPDTFYTNKHKIAGMDRLYLTCTTGRSVPPDLNGITVLIYTDIETQIELSVFKRSVKVYNIHDKENYLYEKCNEQWKEDYNDVRDQSWPIVDLCDMTQLPKQILDELEHIHLGFISYFQWIKTQNHLELYKQLNLKSPKNSYIKNDPVFKEISDLVPKVDFAIKLQDIVKTQGKCMLDLLGLEFANGHNELMQKWLSLHPDDLQQRLLS